MLSVSDAMVIEGLKTLHIIGLCVGLGGAILADLLGLHALFATRAGSFSAVFRRIHGFVILGLTLVWASGLAIALLKFTWDALPQKVMVKVGFTALLTINALFIRYRLLPLLNDRHRPLVAHLRAGQVLDVVLFASISFACWFSALFVAKFSLLQQMQVAQLAELALLFWGASATALLVVILTAKAWVRAQSALLQRAKAHAPRRASARATQPSPKRSPANRRLAGPVPAQPRPTPQDVHVRHARLHSSGLPVLDEAALCRLAQASGESQPELLPQAIAHFQAQAPHVLLDLAKAAREQRQSDCTKSAETLRAMSKAICARRLEAASAQFETGAARGDVENLPGQLSELKQELLDVLQQIVAHGLAPTQPRQRRPIPN